ncbi:MAG TPA: NAD(P)/FAD-dependent oxidoreductase [Syntrophomonadaceae bacterium]|nr:NAD(P)/FAD-dependent oxidoreductase [Syntrophomonadaceae bacterium]
MRKKRICVIGGGPAGLAAAVEAARLGMDIDVFERSEIGKHIRCAEGFYDSMHLVNKPEVGVRYKVDEALLKVRKEYQVDCRRINLWMIDRAKWQKYFAKRAKAAGARIFENARVTSGDLQGLEAEYDWVIDASGIPSITSVRYGFRNYYRRNGAVTVQYVLEGDFSGQGERLKFLPFPHYKGYFWVFPKSSTIANVGFGYFDPESKERGLPGRLLWERLDQLMVQEKVAGKIIRRTGGIVPIRMREQLQYGKVLLVGDAAGCASPLHGGGIDTALITGRQAVRWIAGAEGIQNQDFSGEIWRVLYPKLEVEMRLCQIWKELDQEAVDVVAALIAQNYKEVGLRRILRYSPRLVRDYRIGKRFRKGLMTGQWAN